MSPFSSLPAHCGLVRLTTPSPCVQSCATRDGEQGSLQVPRVQRAGSVDGPAASGRRRAQWSWVGFACATAAAAAAGLPGAPAGLRSAAPATSAVGVAPVCFPGTTTDLYLHRRILLLRPPRAFLAPTRARTGFPPVIYAMTSPSPASQLPLPLGSPAWPVRRHEPRVCRAWHAHGLWHT